MGTIEKNDSTESLFDHTLVKACKFARLGFIDNVRILRSGKKRWLSGLIKDISEMRHTDDGQRILNNIRTLRERVEPKVVTAS